jgi:hypothetical protein
MRSVQLLLAHWDDPQGYSNAILREFGWALPERNIVDTLLEGRNLGLGDAWTIKRNARRMGVRVAFRKAAALMMHLS